jgi:hypothetical protein
MPKHPSPPGPSSGAVLRLSHDVRRDARQFTSETLLPISQRRRSDKGK